MARRRKKGRAVKRNAHQSSGFQGSSETSTLKSSSSSSEPAWLTSAPHSFVIHRRNSRSKCKVGKATQELTRDFRAVLEPFTASKIESRPSNTIKDYCQVASLLKVSHMCLFSQTSLAVYLKVARFPRGPTLTFRVREFTLARDVRASLRRQLTHKTLFANHALLVLNNLESSKGGQEDAESHDQHGQRGREVHLTASMLQNLFPTINVANVKLSHVRRCALFSRNESDGSIDFRHYAIKVVPAGIANRAVKKVALKRKVPNLAKFDDFEQVMDNNNASESEAEDDDDQLVTVQNKMSTNKKKSSLPSSSSSLSSVRLVELGPRLTLDLVKIEEGLMEGEILHHSLVTKSEEEKRDMRLNRDERQRSKERRRREQELNVQRKLKEREEAKAKSIEGMKKLKEQNKKKKANNNHEQEDNDEGPKHNVGRKRNTDSTAQTQYGPRSKKSKFADSSAKKGKFDGKNGGFGGKKKIGMKKKPIVKKKGRRNLAKRRK